MSKREPVGVAADRDAGPQGTLATEGKVTLGDLARELRAQQLRALLLNTFRLETFEYITVETPTRYLVELPGEGATEPDRQTVLAVQCELALAVREARARIDALRRVVVDASAVAPQPPTLGGSPRPQEAPARPSGRAPWAHLDEASELGRFVPNPRVSESRRGSGSQR